MFFDDTESFIREITKLKNTAGKNLSVESGLKSWQLFLQYDLFDELMMGIHPVLAAQGERLFTNTGNKNLKLTGNRTYQNGVVELHYQKA